jgi:hypothetical protein
MGKMHNMRNLASARITHPRLDPTAQKAQCFNYKGQIINVF